MLKLNFVFLNPTCKYYLCDLQVPCHLLSAPAWPAGMSMKESNLSGTLQCLKFLAIQAAITIIAAGRRATAHARRPMCGSRELPGERMRGGANCNPATVALLLQPGRLRFALSGHGFRRLLRRADCISASPAGSRVPKWNQFRVGSGCGVDQFIWRCDLLGVGSTTRLTLKH